MRFFVMPLHKMEWVDWTGLLAYLTRKNSIAHQPEKERNSAQQSCLMCQGSGFQRANDQDDCLVCCTLCKECGNISRSEAAAFLAKR